MSNTARTAEQCRFAPLNAGYQRLFTPNRLTVGLVVPIEPYGDAAVPSLEQHLERVQLAESLGFAGVWLRDVPFNVPSFHDAGQVLDPFTYLGYLAAGTRKITLGTASIILPLRHPAHVAKAAATADVLSNGRLVLGVASGDRPEEYPALNIAFEKRGERFRESYAYLRHAGTDYPSMSNGYGQLSGSMDLLPKPTAGRLPLLITGGSQQSPDWIAEHGDGWMTYPRSAGLQAMEIKNYRQRVSSAGQPNKPVMEPLYIDLTEEEAGPSPIHLGFRSGPRALLRYLKQRQ
ncbi:MAG: TIGR03571 family LLM class oxidoreductase, partial [Pseudomonadota bacterium]